ncbi:MAG: polyphosphate polymerase domain-containing protein [Bacteroidetes bacterium]|nr:polyphosphate polymerase domain-containing protein [Bacteroidota bacterium]
MDKVKLLNRIDKKYCFNINQLEVILNLIKNDYFVLEVEGKKISRYKTLYYDTPNFFLYNLHHKGKLNRYKIRHRTYLENNKSFFEIKFKNNKYRTIKKRIKDFENPEEINEKRENFIIEKSKLNPKNFIPALWINYSRITLVNRQSPERLTIDINLEYLKGENKINLNKLIIAEVKQESKNKSPFISAMKNLNIREGSISKYAMGIALTTPQVKKNNFKEKIRTILKTTNDNKYIFTGN